MKNPENNKFLSDYFTVIQSQFLDNKDLNFWTSHLSKSVKKEEKSYYNRRYLTPNDEHFSSIELVYETEPIVDSIYWEFDYNLLFIKSILGEPKLHYLPYDDCTYFGFRFQDSKCYFETRTDGFIEKVDVGYRQVVDGSNDAILQNFDFNYISLKSIRPPKKSKKNNWLSKLIKK